jgi:hypothetical protein
MVNHRLIPWLLPLAPFLMMMCGTRTIDAAARAPKKLGAALTGKFIAQVDGPPLTGFGVNQQSYVFEMSSPAGAQLVTIRDNFLIYEPHLPDRKLDYSKLYKITVIRDQKCDETLENISRRFVFDSHGGFVEMKYALTYAKNLPSLTLPWKSPLPCYLVSRMAAGARVATETSQTTATP